MKPSPLPLLKGLELLKTGRCAAVMVGDSINDIQAGIDAGIVTIGCTWGYGKPGELDGADHRVASCAELTQLLTGEGL
jgi:phosphoglycolate phosphatase